MTTKLVETYDIGHRFIVLLCQSRLVFRPPFILQISRNSAPERYVQLGKMLIEVCV